MFSQEIVAKSNLKLKGNIIAYYFAPAESQGSFIGVTNILVVKVSKILKRRETSKFIIVRFIGVRNNYFKSEFKENEDFELKLERTVFCDDSIEGLLFVRTFDENKTVKEERSDLKFVPWVIENQIPSKAKMPCYFISETS